MRGLCEVAYRIQSLCTELPAPFAAPFALWYTAAKQQVGTAALQLDLAEVLWLWHYYRIFLLICDSITRPPLYTLRST